MTPVLAAVAGALEAGRKEGIAQALSAAVLRGGALVHASVHGELPEPGGGSRALRRDDPFDVASLTKVIATTTVAAQLVEDGALALDAPVADRLPGFERGGKGGVTPRHLLAHASGLPWWRPYHEAVAADPVAGVAFGPAGTRPPLEALSGALARGREIVRDAVLAEALEAAPGARAVYSDPGFLALGFLLEALAGAPIARLAEERVFRPLGLAATFFVDATEPARAAAARAGRVFVPTGWSKARGEVVAGSVNDDNAWAMGGGAPHAGVFSTAAEVAAVGQAWLDALGGRRSVVPSAAARELARRDATPGSDRALGWDTPGGAEPSIGTRLGRGRQGAIGHLGFTGTSLWLDLDAEVVVALLTNHVHPSGTNDRSRMRAFRRAVHDAVAEALGIE